MQSTLHDGLHGLVSQIPASLAMQVGLQAGMAIDITLSKGQLVIAPKEQSSESTPVDPIFGLGQQPVTCHLPDAAEHHDHDLYSSAPVTHDGSVD